MSKSIYVVEFTKMVYQLFRLKAKSITQAKNLPNDIMQYLATLMENSYLTILGLMPTTGDICHAWLGLRGSVDGIHVAVAD
ncbi:hypothetical protein C5167_013617 [Papaver somniferum]|uniref:Uncharacterized protein n=1 Tax=Papaver somniferum TaxID=3469 RepID=A0A4Y7J0V3_PAPSO|nr:hypothetical protein C5167_013617 [Papaver somniferum]